MRDLCCTSFPLNAHLDRLAPDSGHQSNNRTLGEKNSDELFIVLGLSGGGARAVALGYGVFRYLDRVRFGSDRRSLLDELSIVSTSSAASIPGAIHDSLDLVGDERRRRRYQSIPTTLQLPGDDIDALIDVVPELINEAPGFQHLLQDLNADIINN